MVNPSAQTLKILFLTLLIFLQSSAFCAGAASLLPRSTSLTSTSNPPPSLFPPTAADQLLPLYTTTPETVRILIKTQIQKRHLKDNISLQPPEYNYNNTRINSLVHSLGFYTNSGRPGYLDVPVCYPSFFSRPNMNQNQNQTLRIHHMTFAHPQVPINSPSKAPVVLLTGWGETHVKYHELIRSLYDEGHDVFCMDFRSQGLSDRIPPKQKQKQKQKHTLSEGGYEVYNQGTYINCFDDYVNDVDRFISEVVKPSSGGVQPVCVGHSLGAFVACSLQSRSKGETFSKLALVTPMFRPSTKLLSTLPTLKTLLSFKNNTKARTRTRSNNVKDHSLPRIGITHSITNLAHIETLRYLLPKTILSRPSFRFLSLIWLATIKFSFQRGWRGLCERGSKLLVFTSGEDYYVNTDCSKKVCDLVRGRGGDVGLVEFRECYHDVLNEDLGVGERTVDLVCEFFRGFD